MEPNRSQKWTEAEQMIKTFRTSRKKIPETTFSEAFLSRLRSSIFGTYLDVFNYQQKQSGELLENKSRVTKKFVESLKGEDVRRFAKMNDIAEDLVMIWEQFDKTGTEFTLENLVGAMKEIRLVDRYIGRMDCNMWNFTKLQVLVLSSNNLTSIDSNALPRRLKYLELYNNFIDDLEGLVNCPPKYLCYLGLGRNCITENSQLHLFASTLSLPNLLYLDLSENEIIDLGCILEQIEGLGLRSLQLQGNPCYLHPYYSSIVPQRLLGLLYLDDVESPKTTLIEPLDMEQPELIFHCIALKGLRQSSKDNYKKGRRTVHVEVSFPLFPQETEQEGEEEGCARYETERMNYKETMRFAPTYVRDEDLVFLRDALWTTVTIRIVVTTFPVKTKSQTKSKKQPKSPSGSFQAEPAQTVLYSFQCDLRCPKWNEPNLEFYWENDMNKYGDKAVEKSEIESEWAQKDKKRHKSNNFNCHIGFGVKRCE